MHNNMMYWTCMLVICSVPCIYWMQPQTDEDKKPPPHKPVMDVEKQSNVVQPQICVDATLLSQHFLFDTVTLIHPCL